MMRIPTDIVGVAFVLTPLELLLISFGEIFLYMAYRYCEKRGL